MKNSRPLKAGAQDKFLRPARLYPIETVPLALRSLRGGETLEFMVDGRGRGA